MRRGFRSPTSTIKRSGGRKAKSKKFSIRKTFFDLNKEEKRVFRELKLLIQDRKVDYRTRVTAEEELKKLLEFSINDMQNDVYKQRLAKLKEDRKNYIIEPSSSYYGRYIDISEVIKEKWFIKR